MHANRSAATPAHPLASVWVPDTIKAKRVERCIGCGRPLAGSAENRTCAFCRVADLRAAQNAADCALAMLTEAVAAALPYVGASDIQACVKRAASQHDGAPVPTRAEISAQLERAEADLDALLDEAS